MKKSGAIKPHGEARQPGITRQPSIILFCLRLFFYLSVAALLLLHPGITVSYDRTGIIQWFIIIPFAALAAFTPIRQGKLLYKLVITFVPICLLSFWACGFTTLVFPLIFAGLLSFTLSLLLFHYPRWGKVSVLEPFFLAWVCFRLLVFSRSGEDAAGESYGLTQFILIWTAIVFLFHSATVYLCLFPAGQRGINREALVAGLAGAAALVLVIFILPADFVRNAVISNLVPDRIDRRTRSSDNDWGIPDNGGGRRQGRMVVPGDGSGQTPSLRSLSERDWPGNYGRDGQSSDNEGDGEGGSRQQYTVMVVASKNEPVYMANSIRGRLDSAAGFLISHDELLNQLPSQRFFVTWTDSEPVYDIARESWEVFALSTLSQKYLPYRPSAIDPTIQSENTGPSRYIHRVVSNVHHDDPLRLLRVPVREQLSPLEKIELAPYLEINLDEADRLIFDTHLDRVLATWDARRIIQMGQTHNDYMEKIVAILLGFSDFQYNATNHNNSSVSDLVNFIANTKRGDCVEFSNCAAMLGRLAGIPSRVVTGFLAAENLQTTAHLRGLAALRASIPFLREFPFDDLFLVTDAHAHSWTQFYIPEYGWIDFEATSFAIPPVGSGDANMRDVVIPRLDDTQVFSRVRSFPWGIVLRALLYMLVLALVAAYALRYGREAFLVMGVKKGGPIGARHLYLLLLARLASDGKPIKPVSKTAPEYASALFANAKTINKNAPLSPEAAQSFASFAEIYTELRWREFADKSEEDKRFEALKNEYRNILDQNTRKGPVAFVIRIFSLRGLAYL